MQQIIQTDPKPSAQPSSEAEKTPLLIVQSHYLVATQGFLVAAQRCLVTTQGCLAAAQPQIITTNSFFFTIKPYIV